MMCTHKHTFSNKILNYIIFPFLTPHKTTNVTKSQQKKHFTLFPTIIPRPSPEEKGNKNIVAGYQRCQTDMNKTEFFLSMILGYLK